MAWKTNLTLASAQHLANMGHITPAHHAKIKAAAIKFPKMKFAASPPPKLNLKRPKGVATAFGSLAGPQQAQAPIPGTLGINGGAPTMPDDTSSGY